MIHRMYILSLPYARLLADLHGYGYATAIIPHPRGGYVVCIDTSRPPTPTQLIRRDPDRRESRRSGDSAR